MAEEKQPIKGTPLPRAATRIGSQGIAFYRDMIQRLQPFELRYPQSLKTYEAMKNDDAVATVLKLTYNLIESAFKRYKIKYNKHSAKSKKAADLLQYCLCNLTTSSFQQKVKDMETFVEKGFSIMEKVYKEPSGVGKYKDLWTLDDLCFRPQMSLDETIPFEVNHGGRSLKSVRQNTSYFLNRTETQYFIEGKDITGKGYKTIPRKKFMLIGDNATDATPFGTAILRACYKSWKEKLLLEDLEINGASKDLAGIIDVAIPLDILDKANKDPTSPEAAMVDDILTAAANIHSGEQPYIVRPSDMQDGAPQSAEFGIRLLGLEGTGKQFSTSDMIQSRRRAIFDIFGAGHALTGEGSVSYNSAEVKNAMHMFYIKAWIQDIEEAINFDLIPQLINVMNEMDLDVGDMPVFCAGNIDEMSSDEAGKLIQRVYAVNAIAMTKENIIHTHEILGYPVEELERMTVDELIESMNALGEAQSRSGDGMTSGLSNGVGDSTSQGTDKSTANKEHAEAPIYGGLRLDAQGFYKLDQFGERLNISKKDIPEAVLSVFYE